MLKQGWMLKSQDYSNFSKLWFSSWRDAVCWQITQSSFVSDWQWPCVEQRDGHTRIKIKLDEIGPKKQEVEQSVLTLSSLMLKPHRPSWLPSSHPHRLPKAVQALDANISEHLVHLHRFFKHSTARREDRNQVQMDMEQLGENLNQFFLRYVSTRWLTMGPVVQRALDLWDSTVTYFLVFLTDPKATQIDSAINTSQHNISLLITL